MARDGIGQHKTAFLTEFVIFVKILHKLAVIGGVSYCSVTLKRISFSFLLGW